MSLALTLAGPWRAEKPLAATVAPPQKRPYREPVFIHDAILPAGDGTLLLALWRRWEAGDQAE